MKLTSDYVTKRKYYVALEQRVEPTDVEFERARVGLNQIRSKLGPLGRYV